MAVIPCYGQSEQKSVPKSGGPDYCFFFYISKLLKEDYWNGLLEAHSRQIVHNNICYTLIGIISQILIWWKN